MNLSQQYVSYLVDQKMLFNWMTSVLQKLYITKQKKKSQGGEKNNNEKKLTIFSSTSEWRLVSLQESRCLSSPEAKENKLPVADEVNAIVYKVSEQRNLLDCFLNHQEGLEQSSQGVYFSLYIFCLGLCNFHVKIIILYIQK